MGQESFRILPKGQLGIHVVRLFLLLLPVHFFFHHHHHLGREWMGVSSMRGGSGRVKEE